MTPAQRTVGSFAVVPALLAAAAAWGGLGWWLVISLLLGAAGIVAIAMLERVPS
jgi:hypothetical protein